MPHKSLLQECPTRVSYKSAPQECPIRVPHKSLLQECPTRVSYKSAPQECPPRAPYKSVPQRQVGHTSSLQNETSVSYETSSKSHMSSLENERFVRDFLENSRFKSPKRAFRMRLPPKATRQVSKNLPNERFVGDFLKNSHVKVCKTSVFRTRLPPKVKYSQGQVVGRDSYAYYWRFSGTICDFHKVAREGVLVEEGAVSRRGKKGII